MYRLEGARQSVEKSHEVAAGVCAALRPDSIPMALGLVGRPRPEPAAAGGSQ